MASLCVKFLMLAACLATTTLNMSEKASNKNEPRKNTNFVVSTKPNNSPIAPKKPGKIAAMRITADKASQKRNIVRIT